MLHFVLFKNGSCLLTLYKNTQICVPESGHAAVKYFTETVNSKGVLKLSCSIFSFLKAVFISKYD